MADDNVYKSNPWQPITDVQQLRLLGKFGEELGECSAAVSRTIIQGIDEAEPVTGKSNRVWIEDEIADVIANALLVIRDFELDRARINGRVRSKIKLLRDWHSTPVRK